MNDLRAATDEYLISCFQHRSVPRASELARVLGMTSSQLTKRFKSEYQVLPREYLKRTQVACAAYYLRHSNITMEEICDRCSFGTRETFFRAFKRITGLTPAEFRRKKMSLTKPRASLVEWQRAPVDHESPR